MYVRRGASRVPLLLESRRKFDSTVGERQTNSDNPSVFVCREFTEERGRDRGGRFCCMGDPTVVVVTTGSSGRAGMRWNRPIGVAPAEKQQQPMRGDGRDGRAACVLGDVWHSQLGALAAPA